MNVIKPILATGYAGYTRASTGTYFDKNKVLQTAAANTPRYNWNPETGVFEGVPIEPERTNILLNSASPAYQTRNVTTGKTYTLSFYGNGAITLTGAIGATLSGGGTPSGRRTVLTFAAAATTLTLAPFGTVTNAQLEEGAYPTSYIPTTGAPVTRAADIIDGVGIFSSTFPQTVPDWVISTTYNTGDVITKFGRKYESLIDANTGNDPTVKPAPEPAVWLDIGPTNVYACLDQTISTPSTGPGPSQAFAIKAPVSAVTACALLAVLGTKAHVAVSNGAGIVTGKSTTAIASTTGNQTSSMTDFAEGNVISVWIDGPSVSIGEFIFGTFHQIGATQYGHSFSITDYSRKDTDEFGTTTFVKRATAKRMSAPVLVPKGNYNGVVLLMESITSTPTVWIASEDPEYSAGAIVYGNWADFDLEIAYPTENLCNLEIQGLI